MKSQEKKLHEIHLQKLCMPNVQFQITLVT
jgi:hypothetical protein